MGMSIWVDADACPVIVRELIGKTAIRTQTPAIFVANQAIKLPKSPLIGLQVVAAGFDVADAHIVKHCQRGDLVITNDIPLASDAINKGASVITTRGQAYTADNIKQALNMRDFMDMMRGTGVINPQETAKTGQKPYGNKDKKAFADALNRLVR